MKENKVLMDLMMKHENAIIHLQKEINFLKGIVLKRREKKNENRSKSDSKHAVSTKSS